MDALQLSSVDDLTPARDFWNMKAKVIRLWKQSFRWDLVLLDEKGKKIQASVKSHLVKDFEGSLKEDTTVLLRKIGVGVQTDKYRVIDLPHKINFFKCTSVSEISGFEGNSYGFNFFPYKPILINDLGGALSVDVLGRVAWCGDLDIFRSGGNDHKRINFDLQDLEGTVLRCTLWASYAEQFNAFISTNSSVDMVIVAIQHGRVKPYNGAYTVQNDMFATRVFINEEFPEAQSFRKSLILKDGPSSSNTVLSSQTNYPLRNEFLLRTQRKRVEEIIELEEEITCVVLGTIKMFEEEVGWYYPACRKCGKKVCNKNEYLEQADEIPDSFIDAPIDSYWCLRCRMMPSSLTLKFKVQFRVMDATGCISFVMFDSDVSKLISVTATDIRERQIKSKDNDTYPHELHVLKEKIFAFKVHVSKFNLEKKYHVYTVRKVCDDPDVIHELQQADQIETQGDPLPLTMEDSSQLALSSKDGASYTDDSLAVEMFRDSASSPLGKRKTVFDDDDQGSTTKTIRKKLEH